MSRDQILSTVKSLARSQGLYGRLLEAINEDPRILDNLAEHNFKDEVDFVMFFEC